MCESSPTLFGRPRAPIVDTRARQNSAAKSARPSSGQTTPPKPPIRAPAPVPPWRAAPPSWDCSNTARRASCRQNASPTRRAHPHWPSPPPYRPRPSRCAPCPTGSCKPTPRSSLLLTPLQWLHAIPRRRRQSPARHARVFENLPFKKSENQSMSRWHTSTHTNR